MPACASAPRKHDPHHVIDMSHNRAVQPNWAAFPNERKTNYHWRMCHLAAFGQTPGLQRMTRPICSGPHMRLRALLP